MKLGLLIYGSLDTLSGGYFYDRKLVEYLRAQGDTVGIVSLPWRNYGAHLMDNFTYRLPPGLDLLIQDELNHPSLIAANLNKPYPVVSLVHHLRCSELRPAWQNWLYRAIEKRYLQSVDGFIFNSQTTRGVVNELVDNGKPSVVAYPPTDRFGLGVTESEIRERAGAEKLRIFFLGNVIERKGLHTLLEALQSLQAGNISLDVVGSLKTDPPYATMAQRYAVERCPSGAVTFHGALDDAALAEKLKAAHVLVVPSSYEGFGIVYLEGMGFGLPAIGTTAGAAPELIEDGRTGYLIEPDDARALAAKLLSLASNRETLIELSLNAVQRYRQQPGWEQTCLEIRAFLQKMQNLNTSDRARLS
ncbi:MAG TPA: glycosyltransferase family 1 protein [Anaerolineae bacterium]|jgi:glycosyltransferase involved in cell wall biosynthesis|nr:glycosyltransferase family 1 protein [Anaerolineae bacterium]